MVGVIVSWVSGDVHITLVQRASIWILMGKYSVQAESLIDKTRQSEVFLFVLGNDGVPLDVAKMWRLACEGKEF